MAIKVKTITLATRFSPGGGKVYLITKVTDSLDYHPGDSMSAKDAKDLCGSRDWKVTITQ